jgi:hypothetical protein
MKEFNLESHKKINPGFTVPENYFETFSEQLMQQLPEKETKTIAIARLTKRWIYGAAAVFVVSVSVPVINNYESDVPLADVHIEQYMSYNFNISEHEIASLLDQTDLQELKMELKIEDKTIENELSTDTNLEQYLVQ